MNEKKRKYGKVFGVTIDGTPKREVLEKIRLSLKKRSKLFITTPNPEILLASRKNLQLRNALNDSDLKICDGIGLKLALLLKGYKTERIMGRELMITLFEIANERRLKIYLLGSTPEVINSSIQRLMDEYSNIKVKGNSGPRYVYMSKSSSSESFEGSLALPARIPAVDDFLKPVNRQDEKQVLKEIKKFRPDILIVAFGAPKQEIWIKSHKNKLPVRVFMGVGGALDVYSGMKSVPPKWMASAGFEWLWRLVHEPRRIGRIFRAVVVFPILAAFDRS